MFDRAERGHQAALLVIENKQGDSERRCSEFAALAVAAGVEVKTILTARIDKPRPATFVGKGKVEELHELVKLEECDVVLIDRQLTPRQERNLERDLQCRVLDRSGLILDIFAQRAQSYEGKLQVELAQLRHLATRLVRGWTHLERQKGGIGLRGPGETQLETDRRLINVRIRQLNKQLDRVDKRRNLGRQRREFGGFPLVALVGYTNTGKSTLFNVLTHADVLVKDMLFATLDPTVRRWSDARLGTALLSDTVGFINELPHELIAAFRSTLQETRNADLLLHVIDLSDPLQDARQYEVEQVLTELGAHELPLLNVYNKADQVDSAGIGIHRTKDGKIRSVTISAHTGAGLDDLVTAVNERLGEHQIHTTIHIPFAAAELRARLFDLGAVEAEHTSDTEGFCVEVKLSTVDARKLAKMPGLNGQVATQSLLTPLAGQADAPA